jgi:hypothetical protein
MPNGKIYTVFKDSTDWSGGSIFYYYYRIDDSMKVWEFVDNRSGNCDGEYLKFDLTLPDSTFWTTCRDLVIDHEHNFPALIRTVETYYPTLNFLTKTKVFSGAVIDTISGDTSYGGSFYYLHYELAKGIGFVKLAGELVNTTYITGAIIRGVKHGTIVNVDAHDNINKDEELQFNLYPNPFNAETALIFFLYNNTNVKISFYNLLGQEIATIIDEYFIAGKYMRKFDLAEINPNGIASGIYFITFRTSEDFITKKISILK